MSKSGFIDLLQILISDSNLEERISNLSSIETKKIVVQLASSLNFVLTFSPKLCHLIPVEFLSNDIESCQICHKEFISEDILYRKRGKQVHYQCGKVQWPEEIQQELNELVDIMCLRQFEYKAKPKSIIGKHNINNMLETARNIII
jgi:hypothetical protein